MKILRNIVKSGHLPQWDTFHGNVGSGAEKSYLNTHSFNHVMGPFLGHPKKDGGEKNV